MVWDWGKRAGKGRQSPTDGLYRDAAFDGEEVDKGNLNEGVESVSGVADGLYIWGPKIEISNKTNSHKHAAIAAYPGRNPNGTLETPAQSAEPQILFRMFPAFRVRPTDCLVCLPL